MTQRLSSFFQDNLDTKTAAKLFWGFAIVWFAVWTAVPWLLMPAPAKNDVLEALVLGNEWVWGSAKHPPVPFWILGTFYQIFRQPVLASAVAGELFVMLGLWSIWRLARYYLSESMALTVVLATACYRYLNIGGVNFTTAIPPVSLWCLTIFLMFRTLRYERLRDWFAVGAGLGVGLMCKYSFGILILAAVLYLCWEPKARKYWKTPGPWLTTLTAFLIFLPHIVWTVQNHFPTIRYAAACLSDHTTLLDHLTAPAAFAGSQILIVLPILIPLIWLLGFLWQLRWKTVTSENADSDRVERERRFLTFMIFVPFTIQVIIFALGGRMKPTYGSPLWTLLGLWFVVVFQRREGTAAVRNTVLAAVGIMAITVVVFCADYKLHYLIKDRPNRIHFPGPALGSALDAAWHQRFDVPCPYLSGDWIITGSASLYMKERPSVLCYYYGLDEDQTPVGLYASDDDLNRSGGMVVWNQWDGKEPTGAPDYLKTRYPTAEIAPTVLSVPYQTRHRLPPLKVRYAIVPPSK